MATYQAKIKTTSDGSYYTVTVDAGASYVAKQEIERLYRPISILNLQQVSSGSESQFSPEASWIGVGLIGALFLFAMFTPWILMGIGGAIGTKFGEIATGQSLEEYTERDGDHGHKRAAFVVALALLFGGIGFAQGHKLHQEFNSESEIQQVK
jgi:hypothetical protein